MPYAHQLLGAPNKTRKVDRRARTDLRVVAEKIIEVENISMGVTRKYTINDFTLDDRRSDITAACT